MVTNEENSGQYLYTAYLYIGDHPVWNTIRLLVSFGSFKMAERLEVKLNLLTVLQWLTLVVNLTSSGIK